MESECCGLAEGSITGKALGFFVHVKTFTPSNISTRTHNTHKLHRKRSVRGHSIHTVVNVCRRVGRQWPYANCRTTCTV